MQIEVIYDCSSNQSQHPLCVIQKQVNADSGHCRGSHFSVLCILFFLWTYICCLQVPSIHEMVHNWIENGFFKWIITFFNLRLFHILSVNHRAGVGHLCVVLTHVSWVRTHELFQDGECPILLSTSWLKKIISAADPDRSTADSSWKASKYC